MGEMRRSISLPHPDAIKPEVLRLAEQEATRIVRLVQPTEESERKRTEVVECVRRLIGSSLGSEVVAFGSVPLKTFLPDGDIDLTALNESSSESIESFARHVLRILQSEEDSPDALLQVADVKFISADVQLVKCLIENIIVDISFNQSGGLQTLCFLELVDERIGKDHLFKRSIILVKSWCYYESRILGAHHSLLSTYALETLVLYIFNLFHKSLQGPLAVLYRFVEYFSKFDWDNYCISLYGPVKKSSLPNLEVEMVDIDSDDLLLTKDYVKNVLESFCLPPDPDINIKKFCTKSMNIIDPLKEYNNLGRSVSRSSYYRIKSACSYGARKLGVMLMSSSETIPDDLSLFFINTLQRNNFPNCPSLSDPSFPVPDLAGDLDCHMAALRIFKLHLEDPSQNTPLITDFSNGSVSNPSSSSTPLSSSGSTGEDHLKSQLNPNSCAWDPQNYYYTPAGPQYYGNPCYVAFVGPTTMEELQWKQTHDYELVPYQTGTGIYHAGTGANGTVPVSPRNEEMSKHHGTGTYLPSMGYNVVQRDNRRPHGNFRKNATPYHPSGSRNNNNHINNYNNNNNTNNNYNSYNNNSNSNYNNTNNNNNNNNNHSNNNNKYKYKGKNVNSNNGSGYVKKDNNNNKGLKILINTDQTKPLLNGPIPEPNGSINNNNNNNNNVPKIEFGSLGPVKLKDPVPERKKSFESAGSSKEESINKSSNDKKEVSTVPAKLKLASEEKGLVPVCTVPAKLNSTKEEKVPVPVCTVPVNVKWPKEDKVTVCTVPVNVKWPKEDKVSLPASTVPVKLKSPIEEKVPVPVCTVPANLKWPKEDKVSIPACTVPANLKWPKENKVPVPICTVPASVKWPKEDKVPVPACTIPANLKWPKEDKVSVPVPVQDATKSMIRASGANKWGPYQLKNEGDFPPLS